MHEHFNENGERCRAADAFYTIVTREPEWDAESRGRAMRLAEYEASLCPCGCGLPAEKAHDKDAGFVVHARTCRARMAIEQEKRRQQQEAKTNKLKDGWDDGRFYFAVPHVPGRES